MPNYESGTEYCVQHNRLDKLEDCGEPPTSVQNLETGLGNRIKESRTDRPKFHKSLDPRCCLSPARRARTLSRSRPHIPKSLATHTTRRVANKATVLPTLFLHATTRSTLFFFYFTISPDFPPLPLVVLGPSNTSGVARSITTPRATISASEKDESIISTSS